MPLNPDISDQEEFASAASVRMRFVRRIRQSVRIAASIALLIGICFIASTPIQVDDAALASLSPEFKQATIEDIMAVDADESQEEAFSVSVIGARGEYLSFEAPARPVRANPAAKRYYLIVGSFNAASEANKFIEMHPGKNLGRIDSNSRIRVFADVFDSPDEAMKALRTTEFLATGAWISHQ